MNFKKTSNASVGLNKTDRLSPEHGYVKQNNKMSYTYIYNELEKRGARTSGTLERMTERLQRFLDAERASPSPPSPSPILRNLQTPPRVVRRLDLDLDEDDLNVARILCECSRVPVEERLDRDECSIIEIQNRLDRLEAMIQHCVVQSHQARIERLETIADTLEHRMYRIECKTCIYDEEEQVVVVPMTQEVPHFASSE